MGEGGDQYIIQRALGAKDIGEAQKGLVFAAALKLIMPVIIVLPGIAAVMLDMPETGALDKSVLDAKTDATYPSLMGLMPTGIRGLIFAALIAAIVSSLSSMVNSISTIFTMDIYRTMIKFGQSDTHYVGVGRMAAMAAMVIAVIAARPFLGGFESAFQTVQDLTGFIALGVVTVFILGMFVPRSNAAGAFAALITLVAVYGIFYKFIPDFAFVNRIWEVFLLCIVLVILVSHLTTPPSEDKLVRVGDVNFATSKSFTVCSCVIAILLILFYWTFW